MEGNLVRAVRNSGGELLMKWMLAAVAEICDECCDPIAPGEEMATRQVPIIRSYSLHECRRTYCKACGELLEDSLITTEAMQ